MPGINRTDSRSQERAKADSFIDGIRGPLIPSPWPSWNAVLSLSLTQVIMIWQSPGLKVNFRLVQEEVVNEHAWRKL